jgi:hypothetical protein
LLLISSAGFAHGFASSIKASLGAIGHPVNSISCKLSRFEKLGIERGCSRGPAIAASHVSLSHTRPGEF